MGGTASSTYDELGRLKTITDENSNTVTLGYDILGRLTAITDPLGHVSARTYDAEKILTSRTDPLGNTTLFSSDQMGRITQTTSPLGNIVGIAYDTMGRVSTATNPLGEVTILNRDARGLLSGIDLPASISTSYTRNALGLITTMTDPNGNNWLAIYDNLGRLTSSADPLGNTQTTAYDMRNRLDTLTFPDALGALTLTYDPAGNVLQAAYSDGTTFDYTYDANDRLSAANGMTRSYDDNGWITESNGIAITRDPGGRISSMTLALGKTVNYAYDANDNLVQVSDWAAGITTFSYDDADRLTAISRPNGVNTTYTYDNDSRLTGLTEGAVSSIVLARDAKGQITSATRIVPETLSLTQAATKNQTFDAASQVDASSYDALGRLTDDGTRSYVWDLASRLTSYTESGNTIEFTYDALGNRLSRTESGVTRVFVWNEALGLTSVSIEKVGGVDLRYYIHTPGGLLLYRLEAGDNTRRDYHFDEMGNTLFLSDVGGAVMAGYAYSPYGELISRSGVIENAHTWQGQLGVAHEGTSGLYYIRARYYDSSTGRFISRDPLKSISPREVNPYQYALNNPLRFVDPLGEEPSPEEITFAKAEAAYVAFLVLYVAAVDADRAAAGVARGSHSIPTDGCAVGGDPAGGAATTRR